MCKCENCEPCREARRINRLVWAWHKRRIAASLAALAAAASTTAGAIDLRPDTIAVVADHTSHISQHRPFASQPSEHGYNAAMLAATWKLAPRLNLTVADGAILNGCAIEDGDHRCGSLFGPREVFNARLSFTLWSKH